MHTAYFAAMESFESRSVKQHLNSCVVIETKTSKISFPVEIRWVGGEVAPGNDVIIDVNDF